MSVIPSSRPNMIPQMTQYGFPPNRETRGTPLSYTCIVAIVTLSLHTFNYITWTRVLGEYMWEYSSSLSGLCRVCRVCLKELHTKYFDDQYDETRNTYYALIHFFKEKKKKKKATTTQIYLQKK